MRTLQKGVLSGHPTRARKLLRGLFEPPGSPKQQTENVVKIEVARVSLDARRQDLLGFPALTQQPLSR